MLLIVRQKIIGGHVFIEGEKGVYKMSKKG